MSLTEDLARLEELDLATWNKYGTIELAEYRIYDDYGKTTDYIYADDLIESARMAWLQWCLQEAIATRGWIWQVQSYEDYYIAYVTGGGHEEKKESGHPVGALLAAYIAALEAQP